MQFTTYSTGDSETCLIIATLSRQVKTFGAKPSEFLCKLI